MEGLGVQGLTKVYFLLSESVGFRVYGVKVWGQGELIRKLVNDGDHWGRYVVRREHRTGYISRLNPRGST